ncbi:hypothetical protein [Mesorhizobium sp. BHbdii]
MNVETAAAYCCEKHIEDFQQRVGSIYPQPRWVEKPSVNSGIVAIWINRSGLSKSRAAWEIVSLARSGKSGMVELPRHVHCITKRRKDGNQTVYTFYTRNRNTAAALPSVALPEPLSKEFAQAVEICALLERTDDRWFLMGAELPDHRSKEFWPAATKIHNAAKRRLHEDAKDFTALIDGFHDHEAFKSLAASTRRGYEASSKLVKAAWAFDLPGEMTTVDAQQAIDALGDTPASANQFRAYLSRLMAWGVPRGFCVANPVQFTEKIPSGEPWSPWPEWAWEILVEHAPFNLLLPAVSALFTGQRQGDVLMMKRPRETDDTIEVRAQKTGSTVWVPVHSAYRQWINKAPRGDVVQLHVGVRGLPYETTDGFRADWQRLMNTEPFKPFRENRLVFHGIRKNSAGSWVHRDPGRRDLQYERGNGAALRPRGPRAGAGEGRNEASGVALCRGPAACFGTGTERELETKRQSWKPLGARHPCFSAKKGIISAA